MRQADLDCVRRLFRDDLFLSVDKLLSYHQSSRLPLQDQEDVLLETLQLLVATAAHALSYRACLPPGDATAELDSDLVPVAQCMLNLFNMHRPLMLQLADEEVPASSKLFEYADSLPEDWAQRQFASDADNDDPAAVEEEDEQLEPVLERNRWLVHLINLFGYLHGFDTILQVVDVATDVAKEKFNEIVGPVMQHVEQLVDTGNERLSDHGSDRTYNIFQCLVNTNLPRIIVHGSDPQAVLLQLAQVQCLFVSKMLESSSFNKLLSGVRECNRMLVNAARDGNRQCGPTLKMLVGWMSKEGIVQRILRTNLHQRQYVQEVQGIMVTLTVNQFLAPEHLDMLWAVTEKEDTYEAVKTHMFDLLAEIASRFLPNQLDMLFAKLENAQQRSTQDTQRLLGLLQHLAASDKEVNMCEKITAMVWALTMSDAAHPDVVNLGALASVVRAYKAHLEVPLLRSMRELLRLLPDEAAIKQKTRKLPTMQRAVEDLEERHALSTALVDRLCRRVEQARQALAAARTEAAAAAPAAAGAAVLPLSEEVLQQAAMESLREGCWSYPDVLREYLQTLRQVALHSNSYFDGRLAERLWDTLMVDPPCKEDTLPATQAFFKAGFQGATNCAELFELSTQQGLLEKHMVLQNPAKLGYMAARLFVDIFQQVNLESKSMSLPQAKAKGTFVQALQLADIKGLDFIWQVYLRNPDERIAGTLRNQLLWLYHCSSLQVKCASFKRALIGRLVAFMHEAAPALRGADAAASEAAGRAVSRCLTLALEAINFKEMATMPPVPAHRLAWRGTPWVLDIQRDGASRLRLASHSNEYVGLLRERLAQQIGCSMRNVRMFCLGHELSNDARTLELPVWDSKNRTVVSATNRAVVTAVVSPEPNAYSLAPAEFRAVYEQASVSWMLAQEEGIYSLLLQFIDSPGSPAAHELTPMALQLLSLMPTYPALTQRLAVALDGADKQQQLAAALDASSSSMEEDGTAAAADAAAAAGAAQVPHQTLYALQALCALLFPTFDDSMFLQASADAEATAEASACASPTAEKAEKGVAAEKAAAQAAAAAALQIQQHRETQQQEFLQSGGLEVVLGAARKAACASSSDLKLRRQLSELLVVLLHNLVDAAHSWSAQAAGVDSPAEVMSGAESGAGAAAVAAAPGESGFFTMTGTQQQGDDGGSSAGCGTNNDVQQPSNTAPAVHANKAGEQPVQQQPGSPVMEDALSSPQPSNGQQQQQQQLQQPKQQKQQRQRGGDLPPLPPSAAAASQGSGGNPAAGHVAAAAAQNFAAAFGCPALKLMADTLLQIAVDVSQVYGAASNSSSTSDNNRYEELSDDEALDKDVAVVKDALQLLLRLLEQQPALVQALLLDVDQSPLISAVLVNPHHAPVRRQAAELLERLVSSETHPRLLLWLLQQLAAARPVAQSLPGSSEEFYELLAAMVARMGKAWGALPQQLYAVAAQMLDDEVLALRAAAAAPAPSAEAVSDDDGCGSSAAAACMLLQGRLQLVLALVRTLDRRSVGADSQGGLIRLLLQDFLFPEAVQQLAAAAGRLDLPSCAAKIEPRCTSTSCRKAALELLAELMGDCPGSLEEGVGLLIDLHYQQQTLRGWHMAARLLRPPGQYMGLKNGGATCYMNAVFQQLFMQPQIRAGVLSAAAVEPGEASDSVFAQLQNMFAMMALGKTMFFIPRDFWFAFKDYDGSPIDVKEHQDAYEFFTRLQDFVDQHLISSSQLPAIKPVMGGRFVQQIICRGHDFTSEREEDFYQISVDVKGMGSLEKSLDDYVKGELMEGDNAYFCEELGKRVPAVKRAAIKALPHMLCIHLKRFEFDYHNQTRYKVRDRFEFPVEIDMFKYTADGLAAADQQQKAAEQQQGDHQQQQQPLERQGSGLSQQQDGGVGGTSSSGGGGGPLPRQLSDTAHQVLAGKPGGSSNSSAYMYDLMGVVVHSGSAFTGHYYSFIKERRPAAAAGSSSPQGAAAGRWFQFDDKSVTEWGVKDLELECFGGKPSQDSDSRCSRPVRGEYERAHSAYMLFYERRQQQPEAAGADAAASASAAELQQQQGPAEEDGDVPMAPASPSSRAAAEEAAAAGEAAAAVAPGAGGIPYSMPLRLYKTVMEHNISLMWQQHVLDKDYFRFVRQLVDSRGDLGQLSSRKSRRRDGSVGAPAAAIGPAAGTAAAAAAAGSGSSSRMPSSMSCDVPAGGTAAAAKQQQKQPQLVVDAGDSAAVAGAASPCAMAVSPAPGAPPASSPAAVAAGHSSGLVLTPPTDLQASPGPSSRRGDEAGAAAQALLRLGVLFQFQVYLRANDALRSESNVWTEALTSLMGSGPSSSTCMQLFLELQVSHPDWLQLFLVDSEADVPLQPKRWAVDVLSWVLEAAGKRCARALAEYVDQMLRLHGIFGGGGAAPPQQQQLPAAAWSDAAQALRSQQPPLAQAVMAFVERVVELIRDCVPTKRNAGGSAGGAAAGAGGGSLMPDMPEIPADAARVLLQYATLGPWAAAHLMQVLQVVPDIADILAAFVTAAEPDEDMLMEDVAPLYELLAELVSHASNLPQLAAEADGRPPPPQQTANEALAPPLRHPYLRSSPPADAAGAAAGAQAAPAAAAAAAGAAVVQLGQPLMLPEQAYKALLQPPVLRGLACVACAHSGGALLLAGLLSWNCCKVSDVVIRAAMNALYKSLHPLPQDQGSGANARMADVMRRHWALMVLQPDTFAADRVNFFLFGCYGSPARGVSRSGSGSSGDSGGGGSSGACAPGLAVWVEAVSWPCVGFFKFLGGLFGDLRSHQGPQDAAQVLRQLAGKVWDTPYIHGAGMKLVNALKDASEYKEVVALVVMVLQEAQAVVKERQQAEAAAAGAAAVAAGVNGGAGNAAFASAAAASGGSGAGNMQSQ
ncbi:hypothetical protein COO60DRAFT_1700419 [Scenedesmus sp. NREL 46B-D3]|nr:hypothetical protein COO60DRAFT_1700419 [Scenedesmus sp. NREL 46B-D3]